MGGVAEFKHEPLPDSTTHIRLLKIKSVDAEDRVVCLLTAWPMEEAPEYYALSYTWGSPTPSHQILINGCVFTAGQNCVYALKQAHAAKANGYFWMDALCIDQSTTQEKNHQVGMMGQIYARSVHVMACVG
ncbi:heterokaryon incompatibility protein-domain-containing protein, partial [Alternaria alternata]